MTIEFDSETLLPLNMNTYYFDIEKANAEGEIKWELLHDMVDYYEMGDMSPSSF